MVFVLFLILFLLFTVFFDFWRARTGRIYKEEKMRRKDVPGFLITSISKLIYRKTSHHGVSKKSKEKKQFFFEWQTKVSSTLFLIALISFPTLMDLSYEKVAIVVAEAFVGLAFMFLFLSLIGNAIYYGVQKMKITTTKPSRVGLADEIRRLKELLDYGAMTQEEFDKKKNNMLEEKHLEEAKGNV